MSTTCVTRAHGATVMFCECNTINYTPHADTKTKDTRQTKDTRTEDKPPTRNDRDEQTKQVVKALAEAVALLL